MCTMRIKYILLLLKMVNKAEFLSCVWKLLCFADDISFPLSENSEEAMMLH